MKSRKIGKRGIISDLTADISGVILFIVIVIFFIIVLQIKSCGGNVVFDSTFNFDYLTYFRSELLKALNGYTELAVKDDTSVKNLTMNDLLYLYCNGSEEYSLYNLSSEDFVSLNREDILKYTLDFLNKSLNLTYEIRRAGEDRAELIKVEVVRIDVFYRNKEPESKTVSTPTLFADYSIPCFNDSLRLRIGYKLR